MQDDVPVQRVSGDDAPVIEHLGAERLPLRQQGQGEHVLRCQGNSASTDVRAFFVHSHMRPRSTILPLGTTKYSAVDKRLLSA